MLDYTSGGELAQLLICGMAHLQMVELTQLYICEMVADFPDDTFVLGVSVSGSIWSVIYSFIFQLNISLIIWSGHKAIRSDCYKPSFQYVEYHHIERNLRKADI